jgi:hypothetical protein
MYRTTGSLEAPSQLPYYSSLNGSRGSLVCIVIKIQPGRPGKTISSSPRRPNRHRGVFGTRASHPGYADRDASLTESKYLMKDR